MQCETRLPKFAVVVQLTTTRKTFQSLYGKIKINKPWFWNYC